jgi:hypothetical protein
VSGQEASSGTGAIARLNRTGVIVTALGVEARR